jgi:hypothetical protein
MGTQRDHRSPTTCSGVYLRRHLRGTHSDVRFYRERLSGARPQKAVAHSKATKQKKKVVVPTNASEHVPVSDSEPDAPQAAECSHRVTAPVAKFERRLDDVYIDNPNDELDEEEEEPEWASPVEEDQRLSALKPGDRSGLVDYVIEKCGRAISAVLAGLTPSDRVAVIEFVVKRLIQSFCATSRGDGQIEISVNYLPPSPPHLRKEWNCHVQL